MRSIKLIFSFPAAILAAGLLLGGAQVALAQQPGVVIGTGGISGVYYHVGRAVCKFMNKSGMRCRQKVTDGSVDNINSIRAGKFALGVVQSDTQFHAFHGTGKFRGKAPFTELRSVFSVHAEPFTVLAGAGSGISNLSALQGKRVNIGSPGSGSRGTMEVVMKALGWSRSTFKLAMELKSADQPRVLCRGQLDAIAFIVGHPSGMIKEATRTCNTVIVPVTGPAIDKLVKERAYYRYATIPGGLYRGNSDDVKTFGVGATLVVAAATSPDVVHGLVKSVFENFEAFKKMHPALKYLDKKEMVSSGNTAPLHERAYRYYREAGLIH